MKRGLMLLALALLVFTPFQLVEAQQPVKIPRIGYASSSGDAANPGTQIEAFRQGLRDLGYTDGKNILVEYRYSGGMTNRLVNLVTELVQLKVDVLVVHTTTGSRTAKAATKTIPIVMVINGDPVADGLIDSLARPGGNVTGLTSLTRDLSGKRLELLKELAPTTPRVGVLLPADIPSGNIRFKEYQAAARALKIPIQSVEVRRQNPDFEGAFRAAARGHVNALVTIRHTLTLGYRKEIADGAIKNRLPSMFESSDYIESGGLVSYSTDFADHNRRAAVYVDKILKGAKPADLPVEQPTKFEFAINLKTAKALNLTIPQTVLFRADKVIK